MNFITKQIEKKLGVDLNGDGVIGSGRGHRFDSGYHPPGHGGETMIDKLEKVTNRDLNGDGRIGETPNHRANLHQSGGGGLINQLEKVTNMDLNGDGRIGGQSTYSPNYQQYSGPPYAPPFDPYSGPAHFLNFNQSGGGGGLVNQLEKVTNMDLNGDGRIGGLPTHPPNYQQYGGPSFPPPFDPYSGPAHSSNFNQPGGGGLINQLEKVTNMDLNSDGRIGGLPTHAPNYQQYGGPSYPSPFDSYGGPAHPSNFNQSGGGGLINQLEKVTNMDLNGDGRIGGLPTHPPNYQQYGGPSYPSPFDPYGGPGHPSNFNQSGGGGLINQLEKVTNIDLNGDGRIGGHPTHPPNYQQYGGPLYPPPFDPYSGPAHSSNFNQPGGGGLINQLEKVTNMDLNGDGRIGGLPTHPPNYQQYGGPSYPSPFDPYSGPAHSSNFNQPGGGGLINQLEKVTNMDLNGDGRIGGLPTHPPNYQQYGGPSYPSPFDSYGGPAHPSNFNQSGGGGLINQLEKVTNMDLNGDGRIGGHPGGSSDYNPYGYGH